MKIKKIFLLTMISLILPLQGFAQNYDPNAVAQYNEGVDYSNKGEYQQAIAAFKNALTLDPSFIDAYYNMGSVYEFLKDGNNAVVAYKEVIKRNPEDSETAYKIALLYYNLGYSQKSLSYIALIPSTSPKYPAAKELYRKVAANLNAARSAALKPKYTTSTASKPKPAAISSVASPVKKVVYRQFLAPTGITTDTLGNIFVANYADNSIVKINTAGQRHVFVKAGLVKGPLGLANDSSNNLYVANYLSNQILKISPLGKVSVMMNDVKKPYYLFINDNVLYISEQGNNCVMKYDLK